MSCFASMIDSLKSFAFGFVFLAFRSLVCAVLRTADTTTIITFSRTGDIHRTFTHNQYLNNQINEF